MKQITYSIKKILIWGSLTLILAASIVIIIYLNNRITFTARFRDKVITNKYDGTLSEYLGFSTMLTAEISSQLDLTSVEEKNKTGTIKNRLMKFKKKIERLAAPLSGISIDENSNIEKVDKASELISWLHQSSLEKMNYKNLNLQPCQKHDWNDCNSRPYLYSSEEDENVESVVWIPAPLVNVEKGIIKLSNTLKKEVGFSKIIERDLVRILGDLKSEDLLQVYFIPMSGFVRIINKQKEDLIEYYKDILPPIACFSDRPYFKKTMTSPGECRMSNPYIDSAGNGIVITYSVLVTNKNLEIVGMIGVDRIIKSLEAIFKNVKLGGASMPRDFQLSRHEIVDKQCGHCHTGKYGDKFDYIYMRKNSKNIEISLAFAEVMENPNRIFKGDNIARMDFPGSESTIYLVRTGTKEVTCFHFNPGFRERRYLYTTLYYLLSLGGIFILLFLAVKLFLSRIKATRIHSEVVSHLNGGLIILDGSGNIQFHNHRMAHMVEEANLQNKNFPARFLAYESKSDYRDLLQKSPKGFEFSGRITRSDGTVFPAIITGASIDYPGVSRAQMLVVIPSEQLESTIAANFIHSFSHALKTPVQSILLLADRLRRKKVPQEKFDRYFSLMKQQANEFTTMVTNLMRFSKLEIENIRPLKENHNLAALLRSAAKSFREKAERLKIRLNEYNIPERLMIDIDKDMFRVILNNLLENALKYSQEGEISIEAYEKGDEVVICVSDTGFGVPEDEREKIFNKFFRGRDPEVRVKDGIGIGLYVSLKYVKLHEGTLTYEPNKKEEINERGKETVIEKGSKFIIRIPQKVKGGISR